MRSITLSTHFIYKKAFIYINIYLFVSFWRLYKIEFLQNRLHHVRHYSALLSCHSNWECSAAAGVSSSVFVCFWWTRGSLSSRWVYFVVGGLMWQSCLWRMMVFDSSRLTDVGDHLSLPSPLVMMWWWIRTAGVCVCVARPFIHHKPGQNTKNTGDEMFPPSWWMRDVVLENKMRYPSIPFLHCTVFWRGLFCCLSLFLYFFDLHLDIYKPNRATPFHEMLIEMINLWDSNMTTTLNISVTCFSMQTSRCVIYLYMPDHLGRSL